LWPCRKPQLVVYSNKTDAILTAGRVHSRSVAHAHGCLVRHSGPHSYGPVQELMHVLLWMLTVTLNANPNLINLKDPHICALPVTSVSYIRILLLVTSARKSAHSHFTCDHQLSWSADPNFMMVTGIGLGLGLVLVLWVSASVEYYFHHSPGGVTGQLSSDFTYCHFNITCIVVSCYEVIL